MSAEGQVKHQKLNQVAALIPAIATVLNTKNLIRSQLWSSRCSTQSPECGCGFRCGYGCGCGRGYGCGCGCGHLSQIYRNYNRIDRPITVEPQQRPQLKRAMELYSESFIVLRLVLRSNLKVFYSFAVLICGCGCGCGCGKDFRPHSGLWFNAIFDIVITLTARCGPCLSYSHTLILQIKMTTKYVDVLMDSPMLGEGGGYLP